MVPFLKQRNKAAILFLLKMAVFLLMTSGVCILENLLHLKIIKTFFSISVTIIIFEIFPVPIEASAMREIYRY